MIGNPEMTKVLLEYGPNTNIQDELGLTTLLDAALALSWNRINEPESAQESHEIAQLLIETGANSTISNALGDSPITLAAGYRVPGGKYIRDHSNGAGKEKDWVYANRQISRSCQSAGKPILDSSIWGLPSIN